MFDLVGVSDWAVFWQQQSKQPDTNNSIGKAGGNKKSQVKKLISYVFCTYVCGYNAHTK